MFQGVVALVLAAPAGTGNSILFRVLGEQALVAAAQAWWGLAVAQAPLAGVRSSNGAISGHQQGSWYQGNDIKQADAVEK